MVAASVNSRGQLIAAGMIGTEAGDNVQNPDTACANGSASFTQFDDSPYETS